MGKTRRRTISKQPEKVPTKKVEFKKEEKISYKRDIRK